MTKVCDSCKKLTDDGVDLFGVFTCLDCTDEDLDRVKVNFISRSNIVE